MKMPERSIGTTLKIGSVSVGKLTSIGSPSVTQETIDATTLDSAGAYREFVNGFKDGGEVSLSGYFTPGDVGQVDMYDALESGGVESFTITYPTTPSAEWSFNGIVTAFSTNAELEDLIGFEATIKVSGKPTLTIETT